MRRTTILALLGVLVFVIGYGSGVLYAKFPLLEIDTKVNILDFIQLVVTVSLAIIIPFSLTSWLDDERYLKDYAIEEIKNFIISVDKIDHKISECSRVGRTDGRDRKEILFSFQRCDREVKSLIAQLNDLFPRQTEGLRQLIADRYRDYWRVVTEGDLMRESYNINDELCRKSNRALSPLYVVLKKAIHLINQR